jgi:hypothetical protein
MPCKPVLTVERSGDVLTIIGKCFKGDCKQKCEPQWSFPADTSKLRRVGAGRTENPDPPDGSPEVEDYLRYLITGEVKDLEFQFRCKCGDTESAPATAKIGETPLPPPPKGEGGIDLGDVGRIILLILTIGIPLILQKFLAKNPGAAVAIEDARKAVGEAVTKSGG